VDSPDLITGNRGRLFRRILRSSLVAQTGAQAIPASATKTILSNSLLMPVTGTQGLKPLDAWVGVNDADGLGFLSMTSLNIVITNPGGGFLSARGGGMSKTVLGFFIPVWGTSDWPFIEAADYPNAAPLPPNLMLRAFATIENSDAAAHSAGFVLGALWETWDQQ
jgi:hypothetical protein